MNRVVGLWFFLLSAASSAQDLLPAGTGFYQVGMRQYQGVDGYYNRFGQKEAIGKPFGLAFTGETLVDGTAGEDVKRLIDELKKYGLTGTGDQPLEESINLGRLQVDVEAQVLARYAALGYGLHDRLMVYLALPYVSAKIKTDLRIVGNNNAAAYKDAIGEAAFVELKEGLDRAAQLSLRDIENEIAANGYRSVGDLNKEGVGDLVVGMRHQLPWRISLLRSEPLLTAELSLPTADDPDPDVINDVGFGSSAYSLLFGIDQDFGAHRFLQPYAGFFARYYLPTTVERRLPINDEALVSSERTYQVDYQPGMDLAYSSGLKLNRGLLTADLGGTYRKHFKDQYGGNQKGNYGRLSEDSDNHQLAATVAIGVNTVSAFQKKQIPLPFMASFQAYRILQAKNAYSTDYYGLVFTSFFR